jgi:transcriptional regulator with XRE-family HTH domain
MTHLVEVIRPVVVAFRLIVITGRHIRAARALLGLSQHELAKRSKVALRTLSRMEESDGPVSARTQTLNRIAVTLEKAGVDFLNDGSPGVRLRPAKN